MGKLNYRSASAASPRRPTGGEATINEFIIPLSLLVIGLLLFGAYALMQHGARSAGPFMGIVFVLAVIDAVIGTIAAFATATVLKTSFGELRTAFLKLAGIITFCGALSLLIPAGWILVFFVYFGLVLWLFQLEVYEAVAFTAALWISRLIIRFLVTGIVVAMFS